jgi:hypothetical protein
MGPRQEACAFLIVVFVCPAFLRPVYFIFYICTQISNASADACMTSSLCIRDLKALACNIKLV